MENGMFSLVRLSTIHDECTFFWNGGFSIAMLNYQRARYVPRKTYSETLHENNHNHWIEGIFAGIPYIEL